MCSISDCVNAVKDLYVKLDLNFTVDRKTVTRILDSLVDTNKVYVHAVSPAQSTGYLKLGVKLVIRRCPEMDALITDDICAKYSGLLAAKDIEKKCLKPKLEVDSGDMDVIQDPTTSTSDIPALNDVLPNLHRHDSLTNDSRFEHKLSNYSCIHFCCYIYI